MNNFKNNYRRNRFKSNSDRGFRKRNGNGQKINGEFNNNLDFRRRNPGRNNQNASKLIEKYNDLAREALSNGDKILSENYLQHAEHFSRIITLQEISKEINISSPKSDQSNKENHKETDEVDQKNKSVDLNIKD
tara:strand:+ start:362 stop:763 length:402 start_codon:yes stop_codon:yes gene_type:complete